MSSAPYELNLQLTDDETFLLNLELEDAAGDPPTWDSFTFEYAISGKGFSLLLTEGNGISIDTVSTPNALVITPPNPDYRLPVGSFKHGLRVKENATGRVTQYLDGNVTVTEGNF
jgi:hypothetical protein